MANAVDKLFDGVIPNLQPTDAPDWSGHMDAGDENDPNDTPMDSDEDVVYSIDEYEQGLQGKDILEGARLPDQMQDDERNVIEGEIRHRGFDALAFYKSKRVVAKRPYPGRWGIFYLDVGLRYMSVEIANEYPGFGNPRKLGIEFLRRHERFHYLADLQTLMFESTLRRQRYLPLRQALRRNRSAFVEEALANRQVWDWSKKAGLREMAFAFMKLQPNAYARFDETRLGLAAEWASMTVDLLPPGAGSREDLAPWIEAEPWGLMRASLCPEYVIHPGRLSDWLDPALILPPVKRVEDGEAVAKDLASRFVHLRDQWQHTKDKLLKNCLLRGLNFKPWPKDGPDAYSVRIDDNFRAHLRHQGSGNWVAYVIGPHTKLGHG